MTEAETHDSDTTELRHTLAAMIKAQGEDGEPIWRDLHIFNADLMLGFDHARCLLLRLRTSYRAEIVALSPDEARALAKALLAGADAAEGSELPN